MESSEATLHSRINTKMFYTHFTYITLLPYIYFTSLSWKLKMSLILMIWEFNKLYLLSISVCGSQCTHFPQTECKREAIVRIVVSIASLFLDACLRRQSTGYKTSLRYLVDPQQVSEKNVILFSRKSEKTTQCSVWYTDELWGKVTPSPLCTTC